MLLQIDSIRVAFVTLGTGKTVASVNARFVHAQMYCLSEPFPTFITYMITYSHMNRISMFRQIALLAKGFAAILKITNKIFLFQIAFLPIQSIPTRSCLNSPSLFSENCRRLFRNRWCAIKRCAADHSSHHRIAEVSCASSTPP